jgi:hypothetical protein
LPDIKEKLAVQGTTPLSTSPAETAKALRAERDRVAKLMRETSYKFGQ